MLIKHKLILNTLIVMVSMIAMLSLVIFTSESLEKNVSMAQDIGKIEADILQLRRNEKDFLARKDLKYVDSFNKRMKILAYDLNHLTANLETIDIDQNGPINLKAILNDYQSTFTAIVNLQQKIGLTPKTGLYGELRGSVHDVETALGNDHFEAMSMMLSLRRNEKDFMLRLDEKYVATFQSNYDKFMLILERDYFEQEKRTAIVSAMAAYKTAFFNLVKEQKILGLDSQTGLQKEMRSTIHQVDQYLSSLIVEMQEATQDYKSFIKQLTYIVFIISILMATGIAWFITRSITSSLSRIKKSMVEVADTNNLTILIESKNKDELSEMADAFNHMISNFHRLVLSVKRSADSVDQASDSLTNNIHQTNSGVDSQMQETDMVSTAVTEMVATIEEIASNTNNAADKAQQTNHNANKGKQGVDTTITQISVLSDKLIESELVVNQLAEDSVTIGGVIDVIRGIAEQTNLLALNAAIEAARAGEQGRGFAVVADEVRTLASRTQESTKKIESMITVLQSRTSNIVSLMTECRAEGKESSHQAGQAGQLLEQITEDVLSIMDMNAAIAAAIQEQSAVANEVNRHVVSIRDITDLTSESCKENTQMSDGLAQQARELKSEIDRFIV
ncbi:methyl-accepting chemotaxis protein [Psychromonas sp. SR45-3]|uniref:methyl-accepting chemotaxis protein n=1 Tax=Psychromonas sp. SR45-3 TaxID=2760930 RepID=UPI0015F7F6E4|nr:methyl-accepting chemotaxis protein [Psychromonas sp. SR45-3]MBB1272217.1 methyl-accepting chemotaxis protein [Psychromonas sp. SR45-3]